MNEEIERKIKIENLDRCLACKKLDDCIYPDKEDIVECDSFEEDN